MLTIGLVSPGAMGAAIGTRLVAGGAIVLTTFEGRSPASVERARQAGMTNAPPEALMDADMVLSIVPPASALDVARRFSGVASGKKRSPLYVDCNALSPERKREVARLIESGGGHMVDACIIGLPDAEGGPTLYASGDQAAGAEALAHHGLRLVRLDAPVGAAAALKMCYSGMNKGMFALGGMMILAARRAGVAEALGQELARSSPNTLRLKQRLPSTYDRAWRWAPEMREIAAFAAAEDGAPDVFEGMAQFWERIAADHDGGRTDQAALDGAMEGWPAP